jgi:hypothetical protein
MQLKVVWGLPLQAGPEGPSLISCAASWRTVISITHELVSALLQLFVQIVEKNVSQQW